MLRDDPACPGENPIYIASISKGSVVEGKLKVRITMMITSMITDHGDHHHYGDIHAEDNDNFDSDEHEGTIMMSNIHIEVRARRAQRLLLVNI